MHTRSFLIIDFFKASETKKMNFETRIGCFKCKEPFVPSSNPNISYAKRYDCGHVFHTKCMGRQFQDGLFKCLVCGIYCGNFKEVYFVGVAVNVKEPEISETKVISEESKNFNEKNEKPEKEVELAQERFKRALDDGDLIRDLNKVQSEITGYFLRNLRTLSMALLVMEFQVQGYS